MSAPVEAKVKTGTAAAAVAGLVLGFVQQYAFSGNEVPDFVVAFVVSLAASAVTALATFVAAWTAKHTPRVVNVQVVDDKVIEDGGW